MSHARQHFIFRFPRPLQTSQQYEMPDYSRQILQAPYAGSVQAIENMHIFADVNPTVAQIFRRSGHPFYLL